MIETKTKTNGMVINLAPINDFDAYKKMTAKFIHPKMGKLEIEIEGWKRHHTGTVGAYGDLFIKGKGRQTVVLEIPKKDYDDAIKLSKIETEKKAKAKEEEENKAWMKAQSQAPVGMTACKNISSDGDTCSGEYVSQDGTEVMGPDLMVMPKSEDGFYYLQTENFEEEKKEKQEKAEKKEIEEKTEKAMVEKIFAKAKETGEKQKLRTFTMSCQSWQVECNLDIGNVYAMPDGSEKTEVNHTY